MKLRPYDQLPSPRTWQEKALRKVIGCPIQNLLLSICVAGGKTTGAALIAYQLANLGKINKILIVVPSKSLRNHWRNAMREVGIDVSATWHPKHRLSSDYDGAVITYQTMAQNPLAIREFCTLNSVLGIFDEIHHLGKNKWGEAAKVAFEQAKQRLLLSATVFRTSGDPITFVPYKNKVLDPLMSYPLMEGILDGYCRSPDFYNYDGEIEWSSYEEEWKARFKDPIPTDRLNERMRACIDPESASMQKIINDAVDRVKEEIKYGDPRSAGLMTTVGFRSRNDEELREIEKIEHYLRAKHNIRPVVVISENGNSTEQIENFGKYPDDPWMLSIRQVSEGVNIPRLVVGVFASNFLTELFYNQFVGRFLRRPFGSHAYIFQPSDERLNLYAGRLLYEKQLVIEEREKREKTPKEGGTTIVDPIRDGFEAGNSRVGLEDIYTARIDEKATPEQERTGLALINLLGISDKSPAEVGIAISQAKSASDLFTTDSQATQTEEEEGWKIVDGVPCSNDFDCMDDEIKYWEEKMNAQEKELIKARLQRPPYGNKEYDGKAWGTERNNIRTLELQRGGICPLKNNGRTVEQIKEAIKYMKAQLSLYE